MCRYSGRRNDSFLRRDIDSTWDADNDSSACHHPPARRRFPLFSHRSEDDAERYRNGTAIRSWRSCIRLSDSKRRDRPSCDARVNEGLARLIGYLSPCFWCMLQSWKGFGTDYRTGLQPHSYFRSATYCRNRHSFTQRIAATGFRKNHPACRMWRKREEYRSHCLRNRYTGVSFLCTWKHQKRYEV